MQAHPRSLQQNLDAMRAKAAPAPAAPPAKKPRKGRKALVDQLAADKASKEVKRFCPRPGDERRAGGLRHHQACADRLPALDPLHAPPRRPRPRPEIAALLLDDPIAGLIADYGRMRSADRAACLSSGQP